MKYQNDIDKMNTNRNLFLMSLPIFVELLLQLLVGNVDQMMVSRVSQPSVAAIVNANQIMNLVIIVLSMASTAVTVILSQYLGAQDEKNASRTCMVSIVLIGGVSLAATILVFAGHTPLYRAIHVPEEVFDEASLYLLIVGAALFLFGSSLFTGAVTIGKYLAIAGAVIIVGFPVVRGKGVGKLLGLWDLYGATSYLADILSYSRLLALGLASAVIAQVFNKLGSLFGGLPVVLAAILFLLIAAIGHVLNFAINALGAYVHASRLQYVEFFGKFYEGGGDEFQPFAKNTKYMKIVKEEK